MNFYKNSHKEIRFIFLMFSLITIIILATRSNSLYQINSMNTSIKNIFDNPFQVSTAILEVRGEIYMIHRDMKDVVLSESQRELEKYIDNVNLHEKHVYRYLSVIRSKVNDEEGKKLEAQTRKLFSDWKPIRDEVIGLIKNKKRVEAIAITKGKGAAQVFKLEKATFTLDQYARHKANQYRHNAEVLHTNFFNENIFIAFSLLMLLIFITYYTVSRISIYINKTGHLTDVLSIIREINQLIVRGKNKEELVQEICNILITNRIYGNAWIALFNHTNKIEYIASADNSENIIKLKNQIENNWLPNCIEKSIYHKKGHIVIENTLQSCPECPVAGLYDTKGAYSIPLKFNEKVYGCLTLSIKAEYLKDKEELTLLDELAGDIAYALSNLENEQSLNENIQKQNALKELYSNIIDSIDNMIFVKDTNFDYIACNQGFEKFVGKSRDDIVGKNDYDLFDKAVADFFRTYDIKMVEDKQVSSNFEWVTYPDGKRVYLFTVKSPLIDSNGDVVGLVGNSVDFTEREEMEEELRSSNDKFEKAFNYTPDIVIITHLESGKIYEINKKFEEVSGYTRNEVIGESVFDINLWKDANERKEYIDALLVNGFIEGKMFTFRSRNNDEIIVQLYASLVEIENEKYILTVANDITDEKALEIENQKFINVLDQNINEVYVFNLDDFHFTYANKASLIALGYTLEEIKNMTPTDIAESTKSIDDVKQLIQSLENGDKNRIFIESKHRRKDGTTYPIETQLQIVEINNIKYGIATSIDISEKIQSREALKRSQENYKLLADNSIDLIWKMDMELKYTYVNPSIKPLLGYTEEEFIGTKLNQHCSQQQFETIQALAHNMLSTKTDEAVSLEAILYKKDGSEIPLEVNGKIIFDDAHNPIGFQGSARNFTAQTEARTKLNDALTQLEKKSKEFQTILEEAPNPIMLHNENGEVLMVNKVWESLTGYEYAEINTIEKWTQKACNKESPFNGIDIQPLYFIDKKVDLGEFSINTKDGYTVIWQVSSAPLGVINGKRTIVTSAMDITELKKKDEMMMAQSRHAAMGEMIGMIAHQWRQPIASIAMDANNMLLDIAFETFDYTSAAEYTQDILDQTNHLSKTIDDFRNFFKPDKSVSAVKLENIMEETLAIVKESLSSHMIDLKTSYMSNTLVNAFPRELMQVFVNIINNAKDSLISNHTQNPLIEIKVYDEEKYVCTEICDNGGGIDAAIMPKIFDPYFSTKDEKTGTGLGLYMSKMIIEEHLHGFIEASNNKDGGVCFKVRLLKCNESYSEHQEI